MILLSLHFRFCQTVILHTFFLVAFSKEHGVYMRLDGIGLGGPELDGTGWDKCSLARNRQACLHGLFDVSMLLVMWGLFGVACMLMESTYSVHDVHDGHTWVVHFLSWVLRAR